MTSARAQLMWSYSGPESPSGLGKIFAHSRYMHACMLSDMEVIHTGRACALFG